MSHCTNFKFQYANRSLIQKTFGSLGLTCKDVAVYTSGNIKWRADEYTMTTGTRRQAIVSKNAGFNYLMENMGSHYQLSIEKHEMTTADSQISKKMAAEFQKQYVKNAALEVVAQMEAKGQSCLLDETDNGFEIKFGSMYEKSMLVKLQNGRVEESVLGVKGAGCQSLTETLENLLSSPDVELNTEWTEEYYEPDDDMLQVYSLNM